MCKVRRVSFVAVAGMLLAALLPASPGLAQASVATWISVYVNPASVSPAAFGSDVYPTADGGYLVAGATGVSPHNAWIGKVAASGKLQWQKQVGCGASNVLSVQQTSDGGYILAGGSDSCQKQCATGGFSYLACAWVLKLSPAGAVDWQDVYPAALQSSASQVRQTSDGGYVVAGSTQDTSGTSYAWIAKLTARGAVQWQRQIGSGSFADAQTVAQSSGGGYILAGSTGVIGNSSVLVVKLGATGSIQWQQTYGTGYYDTASSVQQTSGGGYIIAGQAITGPGGSTQADALLLKLTSAGTTQWQDRYDVGYQCYYNGYSETCLYPSSNASGVRQTAGGGYAIAGSIQFVFGEEVATASWLAQTDASGNIAWENDYYPVNASTGDPYPSAFSALAQTRGGGFAAIGYTDEYNNSDNVWLVKTDANGNVANCGEAHYATITTLSGALTTSPSSLPVATPATAGTAVSGGTTAATLTTHRDC